MMNQAEFVIFEKYNKLLKAFIAQNMHSSYLHVESDKMLSEITKIDYCFLKKKRILFQRIDTLAIQLHEYSQDYLYTNISQDSPPMFDTSQVTQIQQPQAQSQCSTHPGLDFDTICFNHACRQKGNQIICSNCGQQEPHASHMDQQYAIHRTSPGFRSISFTKDWYKLPQLIRQREIIAKKVTNLKIYFTQLFNQMADCSLRKLQCLSDLLSKNAAFNVCHKMRQNPRKHLYCCMEVINDLQMHQQGNILCKEEAYTLIQQKLKNECQRISHNIEHLKSSLIQLFGAFDKKHSQEGTDKIANAQTVEKTNKEMGVQIDYQARFCITEQNQSLNDSKRQQESGQKLLIDEFPAYGFSPHLNQCQKRTIKCKITKRPPTGIDLENEGTITVWDANPQALRYLEHCKYVKNLIIEDSSLTNTYQLQSLIKDFPQLQGIHINCASSIDLNIVKDLKVSYLNLFPTFRFIQNTDRSKYFPKVEYEILKHLPLKYISNVYTHAKHERKNIYFDNGRFKKIQDHLEQVNFIQLQRVEKWKINKNATGHKLNVTQNLLVLSFSNITIYMNVSLINFCKRNSRLHTIVFDNCKATYRRLLKQLQSLQPKQLRHLQISGDKLEQKITLSASSTERLFFHQSLETLILTNISFGQQNTKDQQSSLLFQGIGKLAHLTHLNLYSSLPISPKILKLLHRNCRKQLRYLNIGCSQITNKQRFYKSPPFSNLQSLCLDYTEINQAQLAIFMKNSVSLKYLSIQNLNGERIENDQTDQRDNNKCYGLITPQLFMGLPSKSLKYVNIYNCFALSNYCWEGFDELECIRVNEGLLTQRTIGILQSKGIKLNIVTKSQQKSQQDCSRTQSFQKPFRLFKDQGNEVNRVGLRLEKPKHKHYLEQNEDSIDQSIENIGFRVLWNQVQSSEPATFKSTSSQSVQSMSNS